MTNEEKENLKKLLESSDKETFKIGATILYSLIPRPGELLQIPEFINVGKIIIEFTAFKLSMGLDPTSNENYVDIIMEHLDALMALKNDKG